MRLLLVVDHFGSGGAQRQLVSLATGLRSRGHTISVFVYYSEHAFFCRAHAAMTAQLRSALAGHDPFQRYREMAAQFEALDPLQAMLYTDCSILLPDIFLEKVDRPTMSASIEVRVPLLDHDFAEGTQCAE